MTTQSRELLALAGRRYYQPGDLGYEKQIKEWWEKLRERREEE